MPGDKRFGDKRFGDAHPPFHAQRKIRQNAEILKRRQRWRRQQWRRQQWRHRRIAEAFLHKL